MVNEILNKFEKAVRFMKRELNLDLTSSRNIDFLLYWMSEDWYWLHEIYQTNSEIDKNVIEDMCDRISNVWWGLHV